MDVSDKRAFVTGGASGIGLAVAERFVRIGGRVVIADVDESAGRSLQSGLGVNARFVILDVAKSDQWSNAIAEASLWLGPINCFVNSAGVGHFGSIADTSESSWRQTLDINATGTFLGCQNAIAVMAYTGGTIINIASVRGQRASSSQVAYCASKAAVISLTESVALYCGEQSLPIRCNAVCPGVIDTPILRGLRSSMGGAEIADAHLGKLQLLQRIGRPEEVASAVAFLASDEAEFITGTMLSVDGGFRIRDR